MSRKEQYPGGVKLTAKTARTLAMQEFGTARGLTKSIWNEERKRIEC